MATPRTAPASDRRTVGRGGLWGVAALVVSLVTGPPVTVAVVRVLTHREYGLLSLASAVIGPAAAVSSLGLGPATTQLGAAEGARFGTAGLEATIRTANAALRRALPWVALGTCALVCVCLLSTSLRGGTYVLLMMAPAVVVSPWRGVLDGFLRAADSASRIGAATILTSVVGASLLVPVLLLNHPTAVEVAAPRLAGLMVGTVVLLGGVRKWHRRTRVETVAKPVIHAGWWRLSTAMLLSSLGFLLISQLDVLVLGIDHGTVQAGVYAPASRLADTSISIAGAVGGFLLPALAAAIARKEHRKATALFHWTSGWSLVACAPLIGLMIVTPREVLHLLFGSGFSSMMMPTRVLGFGVLVHIVLGFNGFALDAYGLAEAAARRAAAGILVSAVLCLTLVPVNGALGAAIATSAAIAVVNAFSSFTLWHRLNVPPFDLRFATIGVAFGLGLGLGAIVTHHLDGNFARCAVAAAAATVLPLGAALFAEVTGRRAAQRQSS